MITLDLEETYEPLSVNQDLTRFVFKSELKNKESVNLHVHINKHVDPLLPDVYNLAFGTEGYGDNVDDRARPHHANINKVFSTIVLFAIAFLQENSEISIGIDGSNEARAYLYHRILRSNQEALSTFIRTVGVDWYVRLLRNGDIETDEDGFAFFKPRPEPFDSNRAGTDLYRYYLINLK